MADKPAALVHIEKTLADSYRKEIDQGENIWRSLPFFAATLALQLGALFQITDRLPLPPSAAGWVAIIVLGSAGLCSLFALGCLAGTIYPKPFRFLAPDPDLLRYTEQLIEDEQTAGSADAPTISAVVTLKAELARQYAAATNHNKEINDQREKLRSLAGLATLGSMLLTVLLVASAYLHYIAMR